MALWMWCCFFETPDFLKTFFGKCTDPDCCCGCCSAFRPRYKRLVDNIFPVRPEDGLVKTNMEKLTFYSLCSPEKLDRIGEYLYQKAARDIYRKRYGFVVITMEAMDQLLLACHAPTLNLFVESFLRMVQKLLESTAPELQILATQSFVKFANIEEDTPSYHRRYDFFISKFASMCHSGDAADTRQKIRTAGIKGIQAVVRKTVSNDLVENIWEPVHMDKIVPSLLFNMQDNVALLHTDKGENDAPVTADCSDTVEDPPQLAECCIRELVRRASFAHIRAVLLPVLRHLDLHALWVPNHFAIHTFRIIMYSIQAQYSYTVVEGLMAHLDANVKSTAAIRTNIAGVLSKIIAIAAEESVGPSVLEIINSLLNHLRDSVKHGTSMTEEKHYQEALINALGEFANHLPDYQKIEIMMFIMGKIPFPLVDSHTPADNLLQSILLKSLLRVGTKYQTIHMTTTFPPSFLEPLLRMSLAPDAEMRLLVQKIFHTLLDRHGNLEKLASPTVHVDSLDLNVGKSSRPDLIFISKYGDRIYHSLYRCLQLDSNTVDNIRAVYTTLALFCVELVGPEDTICDYLQLVLAIQSLATNTTQSQRFQLHALVPCLMALVPAILPHHHHDEDDVGQLATMLNTYTSGIVKERRAEAPHLLPPLQEHYSAGAKSPQETPHLLVDEVALCEYLAAVGLPADRLQNTVYGGGGGGGRSPQQRHSIWQQDSFQLMTAGEQQQVQQQQQQSVNATGGQDVDDSAASSPGVLPRNRRMSTMGAGGTVSGGACVLSIDLGFDSMKRILMESAEVRKEAEAERRRELTHTFHTASFSELVRRTQPKHSDLEDKLSDIFKSLNEHEIERNLQKKSNRLDGNRSDEIPMYERNFPELFFY